MSVLVAVASRHEATWQIAETIAGTLAVEGVPTDLLRLTRVAADAGYPLDPEDYDAVVVGSAVYAGAWLEAGARFAQAFAPALRTRPVWVFSSGPVRHGPDRPLVAQPPTLPRPLRLAPPVEHHIFPGRFEYELLTLHERALTDQLPVEDVDQRDWGAIRQWATGIAHTLR